MRGLSIVVPAFNSVGTLGALTDRIFKTLRVMGLNFELILVNDGSHDQTWEVIQTLVSRYDWVIGVNLSQNFGQHNALLCGIYLAQFETCVTLDDDLQHPPEEIPKLIKELDQGNELVYGVPSISGHGLAKRLGGSIARLFAQHCLLIKRSKSMSAFRAFRTDLRDGFGIISGPFVSLDALLSLNTATYRPVEIKHEQRLGKKSNYNFIKLAELSLTMLSRFNLKLFILGLALFYPMATQGIVFCIRYVMEKLVTGDSKLQDIPFVTLAVALCVTLALLFTIISRHLFRMFFKSPPTSPYIILEKLTHPKKK